MRNFTTLNTDETYMQRCIDLASKGLAQVAPNPMVGAVLVYENTVIGEGYHQQFGHAHAEVNCISSVKPSDIHLISKSTLYISLEPCNHFGKTPPCSDLILKKKIPRVVIGCSDPFEKVNGTGIQKLRDANVEVEVGVLEKEARFLNRRFFTFHQKRRPYIILKWAQSQDGYIAAHENQRTKISNEITDKLVHQWRSEESGIMVGTHTVRVDNPELTVRHMLGKNPVRIIIDKKLELKANTKILDQKASTIIFNEVIEKKDGLNHYIKVNLEDHSLTEMLHQLYQENILSVILEGGQKLHQAFIDQNLWDEARVITNTKLKLNKGISAAVLNNAERQERLLVQNDQIDFYYKKWD